MLLMENTADSSELPNYALSWDIGVRFPTAEEMGDHSLYVGGRKPLVAGAPLFWSEQLGTLVTPTRCKKCRHGKKGCDRVQPVCGKCRSLNAAEKCGLPPGAQPYEKVSRGEKPPTPSKTQAKKRKSSAEDVPEMAPPIEKTRTKKGKTQASNAPTIALNPSTIPAPPPQKAGPGGPRTLHPPSKAKPKSTVPNESISKFKDYNRSFEDADVTEDCQLPIDDPLPYPLIWAETLSEFWAGLPPLQAGELPGLELNRGVARRLLLSGRSIKQCDFFLDFCDSTQSDTPQRFQEPPLSTTLTSAFDNLSLQAPPREVHGQTGYWSPSPIFPTPTLTFSPPHLEEPITPLLTTPLPYEALPSIANHPFGRNEVTPSQIPQLTRGFSLLTDRTCTRPIPRIQTLQEYLRDSYQSSPFTVAPDPFLSYWPHMSPPASPILTPSFPHMPLESAPSDDYGTFTSLEHSTLEVASIYSTPYLMESTRGAAVGIESLSLVLRPPASLEADVEVLDQISEQPIALVASAPVPAARSIKSLAPLPLSLQKANDIGMPIAVYTKRSHPDLPENKLPERCQFIFVGWFWIASILSDVETKSHCLTLQGYTPSWSTARLSGQESVPPWRTWADPPPSLVASNTTLTLMPVSGLSDGALPVADLCGPDGWHCINCGKLSIRRRVVGNVCVCGVLAPDLTPLRVTPLCEAQFPYFIPECQNRGTNAMVEISTAPEMGLEGVPRIRVITYRTASPVEGPSSDDPELDLVIQHRLVVTCAWMSSGIDLDTLFQDLQRCCMMRRLDSSYFTVTVGIQGLSWDAHECFNQAAGVVLDGLPDCSIMNGMPEFNQMRFFVWINAQRKVKFKLEATDKHNPYLSCLVLGTGCEVKTHLDRTKQRAPLNIRVDHGSILAIQSPTQCPFRGIFEIEKGATVVLAIGRRVLTENLDDNTNVTLPM